jgi:hypothetical protein
LVAPRLSLHAYLMLVDRYSTSLLQDGGSNLFAAL